MIFRITDHMDCYHVYDWTTGDQLDDEVGFSTEASAREWAEELGYTEFNPESI